jgi:hypothetical protein
VISGNSFVTSLAAFRIVRIKWYFTNSVADPHRKNADADADADPGKNLNADADPDADPDADSCSY